MALVAGGLSNDEIAGRLYMSPATAKTHVSRAMVELGGRDRAQLVVRVYESGLGAARLDGLTRSPARRSAVSWGIWRWSASRPSTVRPRPWPPASAEQRSGGAGRVGGRSAEGPGVRPVVLLRLG